MKCQETSGFLTLHQCENQATRKCHYCKKRICDEHARPIQELVDKTYAQEDEATASMPEGAARIPGMENELAGYEGPVSCVSCMKKRFAAPAAQGLNNTRTRWFRRRYYYDPYFYGYYHSYHPYGIRSDYDRGDYAAFDDSGADVDDLENS